MSNKCRCKNEQEYTFTPNLICRDLVHFRDLVQNKLKVCIDTCSRGPPPDCGQPRDRTGCLEAVGPNQANVKIANGFPSSDLRRIYVEQTIKLSTGTAYFIIIIYFFADKVI